MFYFVLHRFYKKRGLQKGKELMQEVDVIPVEMIEILLMQIGRPV